MKKTSRLFVLPYALWIALFVLAPVAMIVYKSFFDIDGNLTLGTTKPISTLPI